MVRNYFEINFDIVLIKAEKRLSIKAKMQFIQNKRNQIPSIFKVLSLSLNIIPITNMFFLGIVLLDRGSKA